MTKSELMAKVMAGETLRVGEYRGSLAELTTFRDKETGKSASYWKLTHNMEFGAIAERVLQRVPDGEDLKDYHAPFKKGQTVVVLLAGIQKDKAYQTIMYGTLELLAA